MHYKLFISLMFFASVIQAQPTIVGGGTPVYGVVSKTYSYRAVSPGPGGANVTWDFSNLFQLPKPPGESIGEVCSSANYCNRFPGSNFVSKSNDFYSYSIITPDSVAANGSKQGITEIFYSNPAIGMKYPFTYGNSFTDSFVAYHFSASSVTDRRGRTVVTADGYGTLILSTGTYTDVLRIKSVNNHSDTTDGLPRRNVRSESYSWYSGPLQKGLLGWSKYENDWTIDSVMFMGTGIAANVSSLNGDLAASLNIFPNPANDLVTIGFKTMEDANIKISLIDITGRTVKQVPETKYNSGDHQIKILLTDLTQGLYFVKLDSYNETLTRKIVVR